MVKVCVIYPYKPGCRFDVDYYVETHMPMAARLLGPAMKGITAEIGLAGGVAGEPAPFAAIAGFFCESAEEFAAAFMPVADQLQADIPNYTDIAPVVQVSDVKNF